MIRSSSHDMTKFSLITFFFSKTFRSKCLQHQHTYSYSSLLVRKFCQNKIYIYILYNQKNVIFHGLQPLVIVILATFTMNIWNTINYKFAKNWGFFIGSWRFHTNMPCQQNTNIVNALVASTIRQMGLPVFSFARKNQDPRPETTGRWIQAAWPASENI